MDTKIKSEMDKVFGSILKDYRLKNSLTQAEIAEKLGISEKYVSRIETGTGGISKETLAKYMNILGISPNTMYKEFINNPQIKTEIEVSEKINGLSEDKLNVILGMIELLKTLE